MMETRLTPDQQKFVSLVEGIARTQEVNLYLTGGTVRDLISGFPIRDVELTAQGNALRFQKDLETFDFTVFDVPRLKEMYEQCMPYYAKMHAVRIKPRGAV